MEIRYIPKKLGEYLFLDSGTLTPVLKTLEKKGFLFRKRSSEDERILVVTLYESGKELRAKAVVYDGMKVALLNGNSRNDDLADFAEENGFNYHPVYFDTIEEMTSALQKGNVDAAVTSSLRQTDNERIIEKFKNAKFYAIVKKGNTDLLKKVNYAIDQMNAVEGDWRTELHNRYYENFNDRQS